MLANYKFAFSGKYQVQSPPYDGDCSGKCHSSVKKTVGQYVKREDETYQRIMDKLPNDEKHEGSQDHVVIGPEIPKNESYKILSKRFTKLYK
jgi:hypothetical protein